MSAILSLLFDCSNESLRYFSATFDDLYVLGEKEGTFFNFIFSLVATTLGLSFTINYWFSGNFHKRRKETKIRAAAHYSILIFWVVLFAIVRMATLIGTLFVDYELELYKNFKLLFLIIPIVIFLQSWMGVRLVFRCTKWIFLSAVLCILLGYILGRIHIIDYKVLEEHHLQTNKYQFEYLDTQISKAKENHTIDFDEKTINTLKLNYDEDLDNLIVKVKSAFAKNQKVSTDTIILNNIILYNLKYPKYSRSYGKVSFRWPYATPAEVYRQIQFYKNTPMVVDELTSTLQAISNLVDVGFYGKVAREYTTAEQNILFHRRINAPTSIRSSLNSFLDSIAINYEKSDQILR